MPAHALAGHLVLATALLAALLALIYAWRPATRHRLRLPFVAVGAVNMALVGWAAQAGATLLEALKTTSRTRGEELSANGCGTRPPGGRAERGLADTATGRLRPAVVGTGAGQTSHDGRDGRRLPPERLRACALAVCWFSASTLVEARRGEAVGMDASHHVAGLNR